MLLTYSGIGFDGPVSDLGRCEVEVAVSQRADHHDVRDVRLWGDAVDGRFQLAAHEIEGFGWESGIDEVHMRGCSASDVEQSVLDEHVTLFHQIFVQDLL